MYIYFLVKNIEKSAKICYNKYMATLLYNNINFTYAKGATVEEREMHEYNELLFYIGGGATIKTEKFTEKLSNNSLVFIPKGKFHVFILENNCEFERLKVSIPDQEFFSLLPKDFFTDITILRNPNELILSLLKKSCDLLNEQRENSYESLFLYGGLLTILSELSKAKGDFFYTKKTKPLVLDCIKYIENNLSSDLSVQTISEKLNFSASLLSHYFKNEMGISIHSYIMQKRLIYARNLLLENYTPTEVYTLCGYTNYSSFYKAYLKMFGTSPKV